MSFIRPKIKYVSYKARLLNDSFANFFLQFHENKLSSDVFYKKLSKVCNEHLEICRVDEALFKTPYNTDGFYFKAGNDVACTKADGELCIISDLFDTDVMMDLCIFPYDFVDKKTHRRMAGVTVKVKRIRQLKK
jgi:hypothetical protein